MIPDCSLLVVGESRLERRRRKRRESFGRWYLINGESVRVRSRNWYRNNLVRGKAARKNWRLGNLIKNRKDVLKWQRANPEKRAAICRRHFLNNPRYAVALGLRTRIRVALKRSGAVKSAKTTELIGCSIPELRAHLESQFQPGMSWENWGASGWHVDHKKPCAKFDLTKPEEQRECFHWYNLQPLWAVDNLRKGAQ